MKTSDPLGLTPYVEKEEERRKLLAEVEKNALALSSSKDDAKKTAMTVEEQKRAQDEARKREIMSVEPDVSRDILRVARTIDDIVNNEVFTAKVFLDDEDNKWKGTKFTVSNYDYNIPTATVKIMDGGLELEISCNNPDPEVRYGSKYSEQTSIAINTKNDKIKVYYLVRDKGYGDGIYKISRFTRKSPKAFRFLAEDSVKKGNPFYINDFIEIYKAIPEILAAAISQMKDEQKAKQEKLEKEAAKLGGEGTGLLEELTESTEEERTTIAEESQVKIRDTRASTIYKEKPNRYIGEEIGLYSSKKKKKDEESTAYIKMVKTIKERLKDD